MKEKPKYSITKNFLYSLKLVWKTDKSYVINTIIASLFSTLNMFVFPYILKVAVEGIELNKEFKTVVLEVLFITIIAFILAFTRAIIQKDFWFRKKKISTILQKEFYLRSLETDYEKFERPEAQDSFDKATRALNSSSGIIGLVTSTFNSLGGIVTLIIASSIILSVNIYLVFAIIALSVFKFFLKKYGAKKEKTEFRDKTPTIWRRITYSDNISRNLTIGKDLRIYEMDKFIDQEREKAIKEYLEYDKKNEIRKSIINTLINVLRVFDELFLYAVMVYEVINNNMLIGTFTFMITAVRTLTNSINNIINEYTRILTSSMQVTDYRSFLEIDLYHPGEIIEKAYDSVEIVFDHVSYSYYMQEGFALDDVSFTIKKGEKISLVGYNGAGKTTLIKLLCGLYHPTKGKILINGTDIELFKRKTLAKMIAPVFQETLNYAVEVCENISMNYTSDTDIEKCERIIELVGLKERIEELPNKVNTVITRDLDETGIELSGGEAQKLTIARAVYKDAPLVILDEPTSSLDPLAEYRLYNSFNEIVNNHSAIFISHRLSSTRFCDHIFVLDKGKLVESGTHEELMSDSAIGKYKELFNMQAEYYKGGETDE